MLDLKALGIEFDMNNVKDPDDDMNILSILTHSGTAKLIHKHYGNNLVFCANEWFLWDGDRWDNLGMDGAKKIGVNASELIMKLVDEYPRHRPEIYKWALKCKNTNDGVAISKQLMLMDEFIVSDDYFDSNPDVCGYAKGKGLIKLKNGEIRPAVKSDKITRSLAMSDIDWEYSDDQDWKVFLSDIFQGDAELISWLQKYLGYCLTGHTHEEIMLYCLGGGSNGKSVLIYVVEQIMGQYLSSANNSLITSDNRSAEMASPEMAAIKGARLVSLPELDKNMKFNEALLKNLVSGKDSITARPLYSKPITFRPTWKLLMTGNNEPRVSGTDHGIWRRIKVLPFKRKFEAHEQNPHLANELLKHKTGILLWMMTGARRWYKEGLKDIPKAIIEASNQYRADQDIIGTFLSEYYIIDKTSLVRHEVLTSSVYKNWEIWCSENGYKPGGSNNFSKRLSEYGLERQLHQGRNVAKVYDLVPI